MWERIFLKRLRQELPRWIEEGWVDAKHRGAILGDAEARAESTARAPLVIAVFGTLLFGAGVIAFFAANWGEIPKALKLVVLFGAMWGAFAVAGWLVITKEGAEAKFGHAFLLLGVILFGANIFLIAQIYHISAHFPDGVLYWTLGALAVTLAVPSRTVAITGLVIALLWTAIEVFRWFEFSTGTGWAFHWPFLIVWALYAATALVHRWPGVIGIATLAFFVWLAFSFVSMAGRSVAEGVHILAAMALLALSIYLAGAAIGDIARLMRPSWSLRRHAAFFGLLAHYGLTLRIAHGIGRRADSIDPAAPGWLIGTGLLALAAIGLAVWLWRRGRAEGLGIDWRLAFGLLALFVIAVLASQVLPADESGIRTLVYIAFNVSFFLAIVLLVYGGYRISDRAQVNIGFVFFALGLMTLYFDTFWRLIDRSIFFMVGGLILIGGGWLLLRQRRRLVREMAGPGEGEAAS